MTFVWTDSAIEQLKALYNEGLSGRQIAAELNTTRNSIIGKVHRLGLHLSDEAEKKRAEQRRKQYDREAQKKRRAELRTLRSGAQAKVNSKVAQLGWRMPNAVRPARPDLPPPESYDGPTISFAKLTSGTCKFEVTGHDTRPADFQFCGGPVVVGRPYCAHHCRVAYEPQQQKRRAA